MKSLFLWYLPQAAFFCFGVWWAATIEPPTTGLAMVLFGAMLAAAYTGAANLIISIAGRLRRHCSQPGANGDGLSPGGRLLGESPQERQRVGVDKDFR